MDDQDYSSLILYYGREKFFHTMQSFALEAIRKYPGNMSFKFYNGVALVLGNRVQEGIRELNPMQSERDFNLGVVLALIYAHKRCAVVDKEAIIALDSKMKEDRKRVTSQSIYYAAVFLFFTGKFEKAKEYSEKALKMTANLPEAMILKGWSEMNVGQRVDKKGCLDLFDKALQLGKSSIDGHLGQVRYFQINNDFENAITVLNKLSVRYPDLNIPLVEKMRTQLSNWRWDHALETANRILNLELTNIEALRVKSLVHICHDGDFKSAIIELQKLFSAMSKLEPSNSELFCQISQLISRNCGRNQVILEQSLKFIEKANQLGPGNAGYLTELGYHFVYLEKYKDAVKYFKQATKVDDSSINALCGLTLCCQLSENGLSEQVVQQIEFLTELQGDSKIPLLLLMSAKISDQSDQAISYLIEASEIQFKNLRTVSFGADYLRIFNPRLLIDIVEELLQYSPIQSTVQIGSNTAKNILHISLKHSLNILESVVKAGPGSMYSVYLMAKVQFLCGDTSIAAATLHRILQEIDPTYTEAHLLLSQIFIQQNQHQRAMQSLEICLSHNFRVRENPMYHLMNGIVQKSFQQFDEALKSFTSAMNLLETHSSEKYSQLSLSDKVTLYLEIGQTHMLMNQNLEATQIMQEAMEKFSGTSEAGRLVISNADLALKQGKVNQVLTLLGNIHLGEPYYMQAKTKMAHIYITHKKDRLAFAQCFQELVENCPGPDSYIMLGDAYMSIQEPDQALEAYKQALRLNRDPHIASKLGRAFVKTHQYAKAIAYYKEATQNPDNSALKLDLAELYLKLKQFQNAEQTLIDEIDARKFENDDAEVLQLRTKQLLLLARVREKSGHLNSSLSTLKEARDNQYRVQKRISLEQTAGLQDQYRILSKICVLMAEQSTSLRDNEQAVQHYKEALKYTPHDTIILASLARLYMQINNMDQCQQTCAQILQVDPQNEAASVMMADLSFRKMDFESAAYHFSQLLVSQPTYWTALARLIEVMRRSGTLINASEFLQRGEQRQPNCEAGLSYCKGLYEWYNGNPNTALRLFNNARRDPEWGKQAIFNMIEICINPDGDLPNENSMDAAMTEDDQRESQNMAIKTAERLLKELKPKPGSIDNESLNYLLLENFILLSSKLKPNIEQALQAFMTIAGQEDYRDHVGPILGTATAHVLLKQSQRAKNQLKRIAKNTWTFEDAEYLERCWLLLADLYVQSNKLEIASELLTRVLEHNKTCVKAYELCGMIAEKEQTYRSAAVHYDMAWRFSGKSKPAIGYKLAYNQMKAKRYPDAIDVCQQVLKIHPDFVNIKKDILDKCRNNLKL